MNMCRVILVACLLLAGCTDSEKKQEEKLIKDYEYYIEKVMLNHSQNLAVTQTIEDMHKNHVLLLKDLTKIKDKFTGFAGKDRLHKIVTIYHDVLRFAGPLLGRSRAQGVLQGRPQGALPGPGPGIGPIGARQILVNHNKS